MVNINNMDYIKNKCNYCKDLNEEKCDMEITELKIQGGWYNYCMPIRYCPVCGTVLKKFERKENNGN